MSEVIHAEHEQTLKDSKNLRLSLVIQEAEFIEAEIYELKRKLRGYKKEIIDLQIELGRE